MVTHTRDELRAVVIGASARLVNTVPCSEIGDRLVAEGVVTVVPLSPAMA
jgi:hypothetical protein